MAGNDRRAPGSGFDPAHDIMVIIPACVIIEHNKLLFASSSSTDTLEHSGQILFNCRQKLKNIFIKILGKFFIYIWTSNDHYIGSKQT